MPANPGFKLKKLASDFLVFQWVLSSGFIKFLSSPPAVFSAKTNIIRFKENIFKQKKFTVNEIAEICKVSRFTVNDLNISRDPIE